MRVIPKKIRQSLSNLRYRLRETLFQLKWEWLRQPPFRMRYYGYDVYYKPKDVVVMRYAKDNAYEPHLLAKTASLLKPESVVIDVGANIGLFGLAILKTIPKSYVHMFEPSPIPRELLTRSIEENRLGDRVRINACALFSEVGEMEFFVHEGNTAAYDGFRDTGYAEAGKAKKIKVPVTTLDAYMGQSGIQKVDLLKLDAEGAEYFILQGGANLLRTCRPCVLFEIGQINLTPYGLEPRQLFDLLCDFDYSIHSIFSGELTRKEFLEKCVSEFEFLAIPRVKAYA